MYRDRALPVKRQPAGRTRLPASEGRSTELGKGGGPIPWADALGDRRECSRFINRNIRMHPRATEAGRGEGWILGSMLPATGGGIEQP